MTRTRAMWRCRIVAAVIALLGLAAPTATAFDLEDYAGTYRATRDGMSQARNSMLLTWQAYAFYRDEAVYRGLDPGDAELFPLPDGLRTGSCDVADRGRFGADLSGPAYGRAVAAYYLYADMLLGGPASRELGSSFEGLAEAYREARDGAFRAYDEALPLPTADPAQDQCVTPPAAGTDPWRQRLIEARSAYVNDARRYMLSIAAYKAARAAYRTASRTYVHAIHCGFGGDPAVPNVAEARSEVTP